MTNCSRDCEFCEQLAGCLIPAAVEFRLQAAKEEPRRPELPVWAPIVAEHESRITDLERLVEEQARLWAEFLAWAARKAEGVE